MLELIFTAAPCYSIHVSLGANVSLPPHAPGADWSD